MLSSGLSSMHYLLGSYWFDLSPAIVDLLSKWHVFIVEELSPVGLHFKKTFVLVAILLASVDRSIRRRYC